MRRENPHTLSVIIKILSGERPWGWERVKDGGAARQAGVHHQFPDGGAHPHPYLGQAALCPHSVRRTASLCLQQRPLLLTNTCVCYLLGTGLN